MEMKAYRQMALLSSAFAFGWSKWNMQCGSEKVIFKVEYAKTHNTALSSKRKGAQKLKEYRLLSPLEKGGRGITLKMQF